MKLIFIIILVIVVAAAAFFGYKIYHKTQLQESSVHGAGSSQLDRSGNEQEGEVPQSGDLCGGTGGIGQIVSVGNNAMTLKRKDGKNLITHLTSQTTIKTSTGSASLSDLKIGERVTLVGGPNSDGSFTADTVVVCNGK
jgi:pectate lyase